jgi:N-acetyltransferase
MCPTIDRQPTLVGPHLLLRPLRADDFEALHSAASDPRVWHQHPDHKRWQRDIFKAFFDDTLQSGGALVVIDRAKDRVIGTSRFHISSDHDLEIGWSFLAREYWGGPTNTEKKSLMVDHGFTVFDSIIFRANARNVRSRRAIEKLGAVFEANIEGPFGSTVRYRLTRDAWKKRLGPLSAV